MLLLAACSSTSFFYNRLDYLVSWYVDDYVDLDDSQEALFAKELDAVLVWHRREELPRYVAFLDELQVALEDGVSETEADSLFAALEAASDRLQARVLELMFNLGATLSLEQRQGFLLQLQEEQAELEEERLGRSDTQYREDAVERYEDNLEEFLGALSDAQEALIAERVLALRRLDRLWLADRAEWIATLEPLLATETDGWIDAVRDAVAAREARRPPEYGDGVDHNTAVSRALIREVINLRSERQHTRLSRRIREYRDEFAELAAMDAT